MLILACGTSYYWGADRKSTGSKDGADPAVRSRSRSEYRYRDSVPDPRTLVVMVSQRGETADTLAALKHARLARHGKQTLTVCNVRHERDGARDAMEFMTRAGVEIGVASTKAFTTQLVGLFLLTLALTQVAGA